MYDIICQKAWQGIKNINYTQIIIDKKRTFDYAFQSQKSFTKIYQKSITRQIRTPGLFDSMIAAGKRK